MNDYELHASIWNPVELDNGGIKIQKEGGKSGECRKTWALLGVIDVYKVFERKWKF